MSPSTNVVSRSYIGLGYHDTITPPAILRNVFENPGWYTPYTPYQAEIAQGRLESLLNFQTMVADLTSMQVANASLLDEATAAGEAMALLARVHKNGDAQTFVISDRIYPQVRAVLEARAQPLGITVRAEDLGRATFGPEVFGVYVQSPDDHGALVDLAPIAAKAHAAGALVAVGADLLALAIVTPPGEAGADVVVWQRPAIWGAAGVWRPARGVLRHARELRPSGAGPHHRRVRGRSRTPRVPDGVADARAAYPSREGDLEHLHRASAPANIAAFYGVYHGPDGLRRIAAQVHDQTVRLAAAAEAHGWRRRTLRSSTASGSRAMRHAWIVCVGPRKRSESTSDIRRPA
jgi:glycine dehydrogenase